MKKFLVFLFFVSTTCQGFAQQPFIRQIACYVIAGQSNAAGSAHRRASTENPYALTGLVDDQGNITMVHASDPQHLGGYRWLNPALERFEVTKKARGSWCPFLAGILATRQRPVALINASVGSTSIKDWQPEQAVFERMVRAAKNCHANAILFMQGGTDAGIPAEDYFALLKTFLAACPAPVYLAIDSWTGENKGGVNFAPQIAAAQRMAVQMGLAKQGPDSNQLGLEFRESDGLHLNYEGNLRMAELWAKALKENEVPRSN